MVVLNATLGIDENGNKEAGMFSGALSLLPSVVCHVQSSLWVLELDLGHRGDPPGAMH